MTTAPSLSDALTNILNAITTIISSVAQTIADNASIIGTALVVGALITAVVTVGSKAFRGISGFFTGLIR
jgi:mannose/fructose/N-acetylgalactosamine-specific phosphotransferase system component IID